MDTISYNAIQLICSHLSECDINALAMVNKRLYRIYKKYLPATHKQCMLNKPRKERIYIDEYNLADPKRVDLHKCVLSSFKIYKHSPWLITRYLDNHETPGHIKFGEWLSKFMSIRIIIRSVSASYSPYVFENDSFSSPNYTYYQLPHSVLKYFEKRLLDFYGA